MDKEFIVKQEGIMYKKFSYYIRCDDNNKPKEILTDMYFELWEYDKMSKVLDICEMHKLKYDFGFESFDCKLHSIEYQIDIVQNNCLNSKL